MSDVSVGVPELQVCTECGVTKPVADFYRNRGYPMGRCKVCVRVRSKAQRDLAPEINRAQCKQSAQKRRQLALEHYGGQPPRCSCCREGCIEFLTVVADTSNGVKLPSGGARYAWLRRHDYPSGFQVLCWNCDRGRANGACPHKSKTTLTGGLTVIPDR